MKINLYTLSLLFLHAITPIKANFYGHLFNHAELITNQDIEQVLKSNNSKHIMTLIQERYHYHACKKWKHIPTRKKATLQDINELFEHYKLISKECREFQIRRIKLSLELLIKVQPLEVLRISAPSIPVVNGRRNFAQKLFSETNFCADNQ